MIVVISTFLSFFTFLTPHFRISAFCTKSCVDSMVFHTKVCPPETSFHFPWFKVPSIIQVFLQNLLCKQVETKMTASILKQDPNTWKVKKNTYLIWQNMTWEFLWYSKVQSLPLPPPPPPPPPPLFLFCHLVLFWCHKIFITSHLFYYMPLLCQHSSKQWTPKTPQPKADTYPIFDFSLFNCCFVT